MKKLYFYGVGVILSINMGCASFGVQGQDPYLWLEDIDAEKSLGWVKSENTRTVAIFENDPRYSEIKDEAMRIMANDDRIPYIRFSGAYVYNFWTDQKNPRGLFRRTTYSDYIKKNPKWEVVLDIDALNVTEGKSWVFKGCRYLKPESKTCLVFLSEGGKDAVEVREFSLVSKKFIPPPEGFYVPSSKVRLSWVDENSVLIGADFGPDTMSKSGYPLQVRYWKRGQSLSEATTIYQGHANSMMVYPIQDCGPEGCETFIGESINFYESSVHWWSNRQELVKVDLPLVYQYEGVNKGYFYLSLWKDLKLEGKTFEKGSLLKAPLGDWKNLTQIFKPKERLVFQNISFSKSHTYLSVLDNINPQVYRDGVLFPAPGIGQTHVSSLDRYSDRVLISYQSPLTPPSLYEWNNKKIRQIKSMPSQFDSQGLKVEQLEAISSDGTKIPYVIIRSKFSRGPGSTIINAYGGFQIPMYPYYDSLVGKIWLSRGGQYVIANIRGGGEFGPAWHEAAIKEKRQNAFNDLFAVTEDLFKKGLSTPGRTAFVGGSNGGLLAGVAYTQKPDYFKAIVSSVPLLDMLRYHKLLAGHSWISEYGNPDVPKEREVLKKYSPYHNLKSDQSYPSLLLMTSTRDDRVHPGHARKFGAKLKEMGIPFYYYENIEGGHGGAADLNQRAHFLALQYSFFIDQLDL